MTATAAGQPPQSLAAPPKITEVETHGVEPIPDAERTARPLDLFRLVFGGANTIATVVLGSPSLHPPDLMPHKEFHP
jgi:hypothetical protein